MEYPFKIWYTSSSAPSCAQLSSQALQSILYRQWAWMDTFGVYALANGPLFWLFKALSHAHLFTHKSARIQKSDISRLLKTRDKGSMLSAFVWVSCKKLTFTPGSYRNSIIGTSQQGSPLRNRTIFLVAFAPLVGTLKWRKQTKSIQQCQKLEDGQVPLLRRLSIIVFHVCGVSYCSK